MTNCEYEYEDGAYVLGALSPDDRAAFERHLPGCATCARSVRELAGLPGLLARVPVGILDPHELAAPVPDTLLPTLVRRAQQTQRRRTWVTGGLVAAAVAGVIAVGTVAVEALAGNDAAPPVAATVTTAKAQQFKALGSEPISGWVSLTPVAWGTRLDLTCSYVEDPSGYGPPATTYVMYVTHSDGTTEQVASWKAIPGKTTRVATGTATNTADIANVEIRSAAGKTVLRLR